MAYHPNFFNRVVASWLSQGWLKAGDRLIDFGAQEYYDDTEKVRAAVDLFLRQLGKSEAEIEGVLGASGLFPIGNVYRAIGVEYVAVDVDNSHGCTYFDLSTFQAPERWRGYFDLVNDQGTIEHLVNPINGFHVAHELLKVGGIARHSFPVIGWHDHGFFYPTSKFCAHLVGCNQYEVLEAKITKTTTTTYRDIFFTELVDKDLLPIAQEDSVVENYWAFLTYRKTHDRPFVAPSDHIVSDDADSIRRRLSEAYAKYADRRLPAADVI